MCLLPSEARELRRLLLSSIAGYHRTYVRKRIRLHARYQGDRTALGRVGEDPAQPGLGRLELRPRGQLLRRLEDDVQARDARALGHLVAEALADLVLLELELEAEQALEQLPQPRSLRAAAGHRGAQRLEVAQRVAADGVHDVLGVALDDGHRRLQAIDDRHALLAGHERDDPALAHRGDDALEVLARAQPAQRRGRVDGDVDGVEQLAQQPGEVLAQPRHGAELHRV